VEPPLGDNTRRIKGSGAGYFPMYNRNKKSLCVDIKSKKGKQLVLEIISQSDVLIENFRAGVMSDLGLGYEQLSQSNERLIYCSLKGFLSGPYQNRTALDEVAQMMGGLAYMTGLPDKPMRAGSSVIDIAGGMFGVIAILASLEKRHKTGKGEQVTSSLFETTAFMVGQHMAQEIVSGEQAPPMSVRQSAWSVYDIFATKDGHRLFVGIVSDTLWVKFCREFNLESFGNDPALQRNNDRVEQRSSILPVLNDLFGNMTKQVLIKKLEKAGVPFAPINRPTDLFDDPHLNLGGGLVPLTVPKPNKTSIKTKLPALPIEIGSKRLGLRRDIPIQGYNGGQILQDLGYCQEDIDKMTMDGIVTAGISHVTDTNK
jgi:crotonobetainyl-CoA:carnitine CoA-transferase CaiB-like acyl-CoA transferase